MKFLSAFCIVLLFGVLVPVAAFAGIETAIVAALGGTAVLGTVGAALVSIAVGLAISALSYAIFGGNEKPKNGGIQTQTTTAGDSTPQSFILGMYATAGNLAAPEMSHGVDGDHRYLTRVMDLSDVPLTGFEYLIIDGVRVDFSLSDSSEYGRAATTADYAGYVWVRVKSGSQTTADAMLLAKYSAAAERPWTAAMVGLGVSYIVVTFRGVSEPPLWKGRPDVKAVVSGVTPKGLHKGRNNDSFLKAKIRQERHLHDYVKGATFASIEPRVPTAERQLGCHSQVEVC